MTKDEVLTITCAAIRGLMANAYDAVLCGQPNAVQARLLERMQLLRTGDLVVEKSTMGMPSRDLDAVGHLEKIEREPIDMEWDENEDGPKPTESVVYINTLDGRRYRWTNASFLSVPVESLLTERLKALGVIQ